MVLQMQQLQQEMQQTQLQLQQQISTLNEKIAIMNARHFGRSTEKLSTLPGQMNIFNEADAAAAEAIAEPAIEQVILRRKKQKGKRKEDLSRLPKRIENHELTKEQLKEIFGENGWKRLPDEVYSRVEYQPAVKEGGCGHHRPCRPSRGSVAQQHCHPFSGGRHYERQVHQCHPSVPDRSGF